MKMSQRLFEELRAAVSPHMPPSATLRQRWDALWLSRHPVEPFYKAGLHDGHIDTALRQISEEGMR